MSKQSDHGAGPRPATHASSPEAGLAFEHYTVGWICALWMEKAAALAMLDSIHQDVQLSNEGDTNTYTLGSIGEHNVVIACLPTGIYGTNMAATVAGHMCRTFRGLRIRLLVGIGGGVPGPTWDVRLGDVVVGYEVVQYDMGKETGDGSFEPTGSRVRPPLEHLAAVESLRAAHELQGTRIPAILAQMLHRYPSMVQYSRREDLEDILFQSYYQHKVDGATTCDECSSTHIVPRPARGNASPKIHYGTVASGNRVIKNGELRDEWATKYGNLCFEMEAAGLMNSFPSVVIRGICDYCDSHKNKKWQKHAAAVAAAYARELLSTMAGISVKQMPRGSMTTASIPTLDHVAMSREKSQPTSLQEGFTKELIRKSLLDKLWFQQHDFRLASIEAELRTTCEWLLEHPTYTQWLDPSQFDQHYGFLWIRGKPGAGKSTLMKFIHSRTVALHDEAVISFFFNARGHSLEGTTAGMYRSLLLQLLLAFPDLQAVLDAPAGHKGSWQWGKDHKLGSPRKVFTQAVAQLGSRRVTCFVDALDECDDDEVRDMINDFQDLSQGSAQSNYRLYTCFSSRHYPRIDIEYGLKIGLDDETGHLDDITKFVRTRLGTSKVGRIAEIRNEVIQRAAGVFMWAVLVVSILNKVIDRGRTWEIETRLREIPSELSEVFRSVLRREKQNLDELLRSFQWITFTGRPLEPAEYQSAVLCTSRSPIAAGAWGGENVTEDDLDHFVTSSSRGLAEVSKGTTKVVQFIHESVRDFLLTSGGFQELADEVQIDPTLDMRSTTNDMIKSICFELIITHSDQHPLIEYARGFLLAHAEVAAHHIPQDKFLQVLLSQEWVALRLGSHGNGLSYLSGTSLIYVMAEYEFVLLLATILKQRPIARDDEHMGAANALLQHGLSAEEEAPATVQVYEGVGLMLLDDLYPYNSQRTAT